MSFTDTIDIFKKTDKFVHIRIVLRDTTSLRLEECTVIQSFGRSIKYI